MNFFRVSFASLLHVIKLIFDQRSYFLRDEVAACMEKSYDKITLKEATRMLFFQNDTHMKEFSKKVSLQQGN